MLKLHYAPKGVAYCGTRGPQELHSMNLAIFKTSKTRCRRCEKRLDLVFGRFWGGGKQETPASRAGNDMEGYK